MLGEPGGQFGKPAADARWGRSNWRGDGWCLDGGPHAKSLSLDNRTFRPADRDSEDGEPAGPDRSKLVPNLPDSGLGHNASVVPDSRTQDSLTALLPGVPSLSAPPHKGKRSSTPPPPNACCHSDSASCLTAGILKKKQLSPIVERTCPSRVHGQARGDAPGSPRGSSSSEGRAKAGLPEQLNGVALTIKAGTVDGDSSGSE